MNTVLERFPMIEGQEEYVAINEAAESIGVTRSTMYYYLRQFEITPTKFPLDKRKYITQSELKKIKDAKELAAKRRH